MPARERRSGSAGGPPAAAGTACEVLTVGHSTRPIDEFLALLVAHGVTQLVDVRTVPRSRHNPQFNGDALAASLEGAGIGYVHAPGLGGFRRAAPDSPNAGWRNLSFRGYADYMQSPEFAENLFGLIELARRDRVALMCAEAVPWRCHRSLIADALAGPWRRHVRDRERDPPPGASPDAVRAGARARHHLPAGRRLSSLSRAGETAPGRARRDDPRHPRGPAAAAAMRSRTRGSPARRRDAARAPPWRRRAPCFPDAGRDRRGRSRDQSALHRSPRRTRAKRQRAAAASQSGQLHSMPSSAASGYSRRSSTRPAPRPQPASSTAARGASGTPCGEAAQRAGRGRKDRRVAPCAQRIDDREQRQREQPGPRRQPTPLPNRTRNESGKPQPTKTRRHGVAPINESAAPTRPAATKAAAGAAPSCATDAKTIQHAAHAAKAGSGQLRLMKRRRSGPLYAGVAVTAASTRRGGRSMLSIRAA